MAYVDSHHQPRLLDLSWTDTLAPRITSAGISPTISGTPGAGATFTFAGSDTASPVTYAVAYRTHGSSGFGGWVEPASWSAFPGPTVTRKITSGSTTASRCARVTPLAT